MQSSDYFRIYSQLDFCTLPFNRLNLYSKLMQFMILNTMLHPMPLNKCMAWLDVMITWMTAFLTLSALLAVSTACKGSSSPDLWPWDICQNSNVKEQCMAWLDVMNTWMTAFLTLSALLAVTRACRGSSSPGRGWPSLRPTLPSLTDPFPLIMIFVLVSFSSFFRVLPLGKTNGKKTWKYVKLFCPTLTKGSKWQIT